VTVATASALDDISRHRTRPDRILLLRLLLLLLLLIFRGIGWLLQLLLLRLLLLLLLLIFRGIGQDRTES
jgi:hypothetical protein